MPQCRSDLVLTHFLSLDWLKLLSATIDFLFKYLNPSKLFCIVCLCMVADLRIILIFHLWHNTESQLLLKDFGKLVISGHTNYVNFN